MTREDLKLAVESHTADIDIGLLEKGATALYSVWLNNQSKKRLHDLLMEQWEETCKNSEREDLIETIVDCQFQLMYPDEEV